MPYYYMAAQHQLFTVFEGVRGTVKARPANSFASSFCSKETGRVWKSPSEPSMITPHEPEKFQQHETFRSLK